MVRQEISDLLEKYFDGETSIEEEKILKEYFLHTENIPEEWKEYKTLFSYFEVASEQTYERDILLPKKRSYRLPIGFSAVAAVIIAIFLWKPAQEIPGTIENSDKSIQATENARSLFMIMGEAPGESMEKLEYLNELNALKIMKEEKYKEHQQMDSLAKEKQDNHKN